MQEDFQPQINQVPKRLLKFYKNGDNEIEEPLLLQLIKESTLLSVRKQLEQSGRFPMILNLRIFTVEGIEVFADDIQYQKHDTVLYVSCNGEEYDTSTGFKQYEMLHRLGSGGFGTVLLARHRFTKKKFAIKIVNTSSAGTAEVTPPNYKLVIKDIDMVFREAEMLKHLHHPNIVSIFNFFTLNNMNVVFVMEYLQGGDLRNRIKEKGQVSESEALTYFTQISEAVSYCHSQGLIHHDLKLENIMLARQDDSVVKVVDFGIAGLAYNYNVQNLDAGSLRYMAPETLTQRIKKLGPHIDIWALGVILYAMVFGSLPFDAPTTKQTKQLIMEGQITFPAGVSTTPELKDLIRKILCVDMRKRITMTDIILHKWTQGIWSQPNLINTIELPIETIIYNGNDVGQNHARDLNKALYTTLKPHNPTYDQLGQMTELIKHPLLKVPKEMIQYLPLIESILRKEGKLDQKPDSPWKRGLRRINSIRKSVSERNCDSPLSDQKKPFMLSPFSTLKDEPIQDIEKNMTVIQRIRLLRQNIPKELLSKDFTQVVQKFKNNKVKGSLDRLSKNYHIKVELDKPYQLKSPVSVTKSLMFKSNIIQTQQIPSQTMNIRRDEKIYRNPTLPTFTPMGQIEDFNSSNESWIWTRQNNVRTGFFKKFDQNSKKKTNKFLSLNL